MRPATGRQTTITASGITAGAGGITQSNRMRGSEC